MVQVDIALPCGHTKERGFCWQAQAPERLACNKLVDVLVPHCGHTVRIPCGASAGVRSVRGWLVGPSLQCLSVFSSWSAVLSFPLPLGRSVHHSSAACPATCCLAGRIFVHRRSHVIFIYIVEDLPLNSFPVRQGICLQA
jgi:hypothetical protein